MKMRIVNKKSPYLASILLLIGSALLCSYSFKVRAAECTAPPAIQVYFQTDVSSISINPSVRVGKILAQFQARWPSTDIGCSAGITTTGYGNIRGIGSTTYFNTEVGGVYVYDTNVPGIGYAVRMNNWGNFLPNWTFQKFWPGGGQFSSYGTLGPTIPSHGGEMFLIKTGPISTEPKNIGPMKVGSYTVTTKSAGGISGEFLGLYLNVPILTVPTGGSCTVTNSAIKVPLPKTLHSEFNTTGKTLGDTSFNLPIQCSSPTNISMQFSGDVTDVPNAIFKNTNSDTAAHVGIQILGRDNNPIPTGTNTSIPLGNVTGVLNYPMTARYYTLAPGTPTGPVNAIAYATLIFN